MTNFRRGFWNYLFHFLWIFFKVWRLEFETSHLHSLPPLQCPNPILPQIFIDLLTKFDLFMGFSLGIWGRTWLLDLPQLARNEGSVNLALTNDGGGEDYSRSRLEKVCLGFSLISQKQIQASTLEMPCLRFGLVFPKQIQVSTLEKLWLGIPKQIQAAA